MPIQSQRNIAKDGMNLEIDEGYLPETMARFLKGWQLEVNENRSGDTQGGNTESANAYVFTKNQSNELFADVVLPTGVNKSIRGGFVPETGMYYSCLWNSLGNHSIWQLDATNRTIQKVLETPCLGFVYDAKHFITPTRFAYVVYTTYDKDSNVPITKTVIFITDDNGRTKEIFVNDAIATNGLTHEFFGEGECCDICTMITMGAPAKPTGCITVEPVQRYFPSQTPEEVAIEKAKPNTLNFKAWQWRLKAIDVWGRQSFHGVISDQWYNSSSNSCTNDETQYPRCVDLTFSANCKYIAQLVLEYHVCGNSEILNNFSQPVWKEYQTINKYSDCDTDGAYIPNFWEREINPIYYQPISYDNPITYNEILNEFTVRFCGNKECKTIPVSETSLTQNYIANKSNSVFRLGNKIGVANNERGFNPLLCQDAEALTFSTSEDETCNPLVYRKIRIFGYIWSPLDNSLTNVRFVEPASGTPKTTVAYGRIGHEDGTWGNTGKNNPTFYNQYFNGVNNFVMYAKGHPDIYAVAKQIDMFSGSPVDIGVSQTKMANPNIMLMWEFYIPAGKYIFKIADPLAGVREMDATVFSLFPIGGNPKFYQTSADMVGLTSLASPGTLVNEQYELDVDCLTADFELLTTPVMIWDLTRDMTGLTNYPNVVKGYYQNSLLIAYPTIPQYGIEKAVVTPINHPVTAYSCQLTDSNGHYFMTTKGSGIGIGTQLQALLSVAGCNPQTANSGASTGTNEFVGEWVNSAMDTYKIVGKIIDCNTSKGLLGQVVVYQNGHYASTDSEGNFIIYAHGLLRTDELIIANAIGGCFRTICGDPCSVAFPNVAILVPLCNVAREVLLPNYGIQESEFSFDKTLLEGKYGVGIVLEDCLGMETFVQGDAYVEIDETSNINKISWNFAGLTVPTNFTKMSFYVTENLTYSAFMEWIIDYAVLEDNNGNISFGATVITDPKRVRIYINSLINYTAYSQTNTGWQFLKGDLLKIFQLGNGDNLNISKLVSYREGDSYVTIEYDEATMGSIKDNLTGAKIRLLRPQNCTSTELFYQLCSYIAIENGVPVLLSGTLNYSNVFKLTRSVPIYTYDIQVITTTVNIYDTQGNVIGEKEATIPVPIPKATGNKKTLIFNHNSPSDFWGSGCWGKGRVSSKNIYERIHRLTTEISLGNGISAEGSTNYLHWFETSGATQLDESSYHYITAVIVGTNILLVICRNDYSTLLFNQNEFIRDDKTGQIYANGAQNGFGKPRTKIGDDYGCAQGDINTIFSQSGLVFYLDTTKGVLVRHNFDEAQDFTPNGLRAYLREKIFANAKWNATLPNNPEQHKVFISAICPKKNEYIMTSFDLASDTHGNDLRTENIDANETYAVDIFDPKKLFKAMYHATPEMWDAIFTPNIGNQLISFVNGKCYIHYPVLDTDENFLTFYGVQYKPVMTLIFNKENIVNKNFLFVETKIKQHQLYISAILTEAGQESRVMPLWWIFADNGWYCPLLCQTNYVPDPMLPNQTGINAIIDSNGLNGKWIRAEFVTKDDDDGKYAELTSIELYFSILGK